MSSNIFSMAGSAMKSLGGLYSGYSQSASEESQARAMRYQATLDRQRAALAFQQGNQNEEAQRRRAGIEAGEARAAAAQSGTGLTTGSNLDVIQQNATNAELDALNIRYGAELQARGSLAEADMEDFNAGIMSKRASYTKRSAWMGFAASELSNAGKYVGSLSSGGKG